jgi:hypothetical protein
MDKVQVWQELWLLISGDVEFVSGRSAKATVIERRGRMQFKTKDLLVTVVPKAAANEDLAKVCLLHTVVCLHPTFCQGGSLCFTQSLCRGTLCGQCSQFISCPGCSLHFTGGCGLFNSCGLDRSVCDPTIYCMGATRDPYVIENREDLITLRADLKETLSKLDQIEKAGLPSVIRSKADAEALEASLTEALEQVRAAKKGVK